MRSESLIQVTFSLTFQDVYGLARRGVKMLSIVASCFFLQLCDSPSFVSISRDKEMLKLDSISVQGESIVRQPLGEFTGLPAADTFWVTSSPHLIAVFEDAPSGARLTILKQTSSKVRVYRQVRVWHRAFSIWQSPKHLYVFDEQQRQDVSVDGVTVSFVKPPKPFENWPEMDQKAERLVKLLNQQGIGTPIRGDHVGGFKKTDYWPLSSGHMGALNETADLFAVLRRNNNKNVVSVFKWSDGSELYSTQEVEAATSISFFGDALIVAFHSKGNTQCLIYRRGKLIGSMNALAAG
jgi:hypothetical protein